MTMTMTIVIIQAVLVKYTIILIIIQAVSNVPPKQYNCTFEPYIALNIIKQSWTNRRQELHSFRTRGIRNTASPIYGETFVVADVKSYEAKVR